MWYSARLIHRSEIEAADYDHPLFEEVIVILEADDMECAKVEADRVAAEGQHAYRNHLGEEVNWRLVEVAEIQDLGEDSVYSGMEVFSRLRRRGQDE